MARQKIDNNPTPPSGYYVYTLARPNGKPFYVGKGKGRRAEYHLDEARKGYCHCRKCLIIQEVERSRKHVIITYHFQTDDNEIAMREERRLIKEFGQVYALCNRTHNLHRPHEAVVFLNEAEVLVYVDNQHMLRDERAEFLRRWAGDRVEHVRDAYRVARLQQDDEGMATALAEIEHLRASYKMRARVLQPYLI